MHALALSLHLFLHVMISLGGLRLMMQGKFDMCYLVLMMLAGISWRVTKSNECFLNRYHGDMGIHECLSLLTQNYITSYFFSTLSLLVIYLNIYHIYKSHESQNIALILFILYLYNPCFYLKNL